MPESVQVIYTINLEGSKENNKVDVFCGKLAWTIYVVNKRLFPFIASCWSSCAVDNLLDCSCTTAKSGHYIWSYQQGWLDPFCSIYWKLIHNQ